MSFYERHVLPRIVNVAMNASHVNDERSQVLQDVHGDVLEVGFGSGLNLPYYPTRVRRVVGVDPSLTGWKLARKRVRECPFPVDHVVQSGESIPATDASFDFVVTTFTLCTIPDVESALREMWRVLKPGGRFHFVEHGQSDDPRVRRWQDRWDPIQGWLFGGCHVNRPIDRLIQSADFTMERVEKFYSRGPRAVASFYHGVARKEV